MNKSKDRLYVLAKDIGIKESDVEESVRVLGYRNALSYTEFFAEHSFTKERYLNGVGGIAAKVISIDELRNLAKTSLLDVSAHEIIAKFNLGERQLKQGDVKRESILVGRVQEIGEQPNKDHFSSYALGKLDTE